MLDKKEGRKGWREEEGWNKDKDWWGNDSVHWRETDVPQLNTLFIHWVNTYWAPVNASATLGFDA